VKILAGFWFVLSFASVWAWAVAHQIVIYYFASVAIDQLPAPTSQSNGFYKWFFGVAQVAAANWNRGKRGITGGLNVPSQANGGSSSGSGSRP
jgi:uncharacterized membrane protein YgcG